MAEFACEVVRVKVHPHPNADRLEIAQVGDYQSIIGKGYIEDGDLAVYIPEQAVVPEWLLRELKLWDETKGKGMCAGSAGDRVKAVKLRGILSQGLVLKIDQGSDICNAFVSAPTEDGAGVANYVDEGDDVAEFLGITKHQPKLPSHMAGKAIGVDLDITHNYDFDNIKKRPELFDSSDDVVITEKIHGTLLQIAVVPKSKENERFYKGRVVITSKGLGGRGIILDHNDETNLYAQAAKKHGLLDSMLMLTDFCDATDMPLVLFGEVFGRTESGAMVQDLTYNDEPLDFRAFDACIGVRAQAEFAPFQEFIELCNALNVKMVPTLYVGPYSKERVLELTDGNTTLTEKEQIREGVVVRCLHALNHPRYGRKIAKSISEAYLMRKNATEYN